MFPFSTQKITQLKQTDVLMHQFTGVRIDSNISVVFFLFLCHSDIEDDRFHKAWKKSIMLVWRQIAHHKYGNVFMDKVTDEIAPGYSKCIHR